MQSRRSGKKKAIPIVRSFLDTPVLKQSTPFRQSVRTQSSIKEEFECYQRAVEQTSIDLVADSVAMSSAEFARVSDSSPSFDGTCIDRTWGLSGTAVEVMICTRTGLIG